MHMRATNSATDMIPVSTPSLVSPNNTLPDQGQATRPLVFHTHTTSSQVPGRSRYLHVDMERGTVTARKMERY